MIIKCYTNIIYLLVILNNIGNNNFISNNNYENNINY